MSVCVCVRAQIYYAEYVGYPDSPPPPPPPVRYPSFSLPFPLRGKTALACEEEFLDIAQDEASYGAVTFPMLVRLWRSVVWVDVPPRADTYSSVYAGCVGVG